ncbi:MAG: ferrochelatase [Gemmatimonadetes bacterium]|nr:ferrochelatase [Gemmatimonadota bacterium]
MTTHHVILVTYGEPPTAAFGPQLVYSWRILLGLTRSVAPIPRWVLPIIALRRARLRQRVWAKERYLSPLESITRLQAEGLRAALATAAPERHWRVHVAYEFRGPPLGSVLDRLPPGDPVEIVPMYAADSAFTHELSRRAVEDWVTRFSGRNGPRRAPVRVLPPLDERMLAQLSALHVHRELGARGHRPDARWALVLAAHGTPLDPPRPVETGREATECVCRLITHRLHGDFGVIENGWLNHVYGGRWTEPPVDEALRAVSEAGFRRVAYFPYGFVADNAESQLEGRQALRARPELESVHLPCLNAAPDFLAALAGSVVAAARDAEGA